MALNLAIELSKSNNQVKVITSTTRKDPDDFSFQVIRCVSFFMTLNHIKWGDVFVQFNISLRGVLPWLISGRPLVATHHSVYPRNKFTGRIKNFISRFASINTGCSLFITEKLNRGQLLPNLYDEAIFKPANKTDQENRIAFVGRLVSEKGCAVLLFSLKLLEQLHGLLPILTIIGEGPERLPLESLARELNITHRLSFTGSQEGEKLAHTLNQQTILVVPSVYQEPFGIVALEGIACGCFVIGTQAGGLPEAIGSCGVTFPLGDVITLTALIAKALKEPNWRQAYLANAETHLAPHTKSSVTKQFLDILKNNL